MYNVQCTVQCTLYIVHCTLYTVHSMCNYYYIIKTNLNKNLKSFLYI